MAVPRIAAAGIAALCVLTGACSTGTDGADDGLMSIVTTVSPITNIVHNIAGDKARIHGIVPEGVNSHTFEPSPSDARQLASADVVFTNGLGLEEPTRELADSNVRKGVEVVLLADATISRNDYIFDFSFPKAGGDPNPHLWTHPLYALRFAEIVTEALKKLAPTDAAYFDGNLKVFGERIAALDAAVVAATETVPAGNRKLLTYHDSFPYFARHYGWTVIGAIQPADFAEPTPREVARLIQQVRAAKVPAIFGSEVFSSPVLSHIAKATGARYVDDLRDDDLPGEPGAADHSYLGLMVFDFRTIVGALGGDAAAFAAVDTSNIAGEGTVTYK